MFNTHQHLHRDQAFKTYAALLFLVYCIYMIMYGIQPMFNTISQDLGVDKSMIGLLVSVFMFSLSIAPLCVGMVLGKIGLQKAIFYSALLFGMSGLGIYFAPSYAVLLVVRTFQAFLTPILLTSIMAGVAAMFRHFDMKRALAGYITSSLLGSLSGRLLGGLCTQFWGWRLTLTGICFLCFLCLPALRHLPESGLGHTSVHKLSDYREVLRQKGVAGLLFVEACGMFVFAAIGNLLPLRMAELGQGNSEGLIGLMYLGYSVGLVASMGLGVLTRLFGTSGRLLLFGATLFTLSLLILPVPSVWLIFTGLWFVALGEFIIHALCPGLINKLATASGKCDRSMVNGLFLSSYYFGGLLGSWIPGLLYAHVNWIACWLCIQAIQIISFTVALCWQKKMSSYM